MGFETGRDGAIMVVFEGLPCCGQRSAELHHTTLCCKEVGGKSFVEDESLEMERRTQSVDRPGQTQ